jgi:hypothetical protein
MIIPDKGSFFRENKHGFSLPHHHCTERTMALSGNKPYSLDCFAAAYNGADITCLFSAPYKPYFHLISQTKRPS